MGLLDTILADDALNVFASPDDFAELVVFVPRTVVHGTATATVAGGAVTGLTVVTGGTYPAGYTPPVVILGDGSGAAAEATLVDGEITAFTVTAGGEGYTAATVVVGGVYAVVMRDPPYDPTDSNAPRAKMMVNLPVAKVPSIDAGGDTVVVAYRLGGTAKPYLVGGPVKQDLGLWRLPIVG